MASNAQLQAFGSWGQPQVADVLLPLAVRSDFTYRVPAELQEQAAAGKRVLAPFGKKKVYTGVIRRVYPESELGAAIKLRNLSEVLDDVPAIAPPQFALFDWVAAYYLCSPGEVLKAALPPGLKLQSDEAIWPGPNADTPVEQLTDREYLILEALETQAVLTPEEAAEILELKQPQPVLQAMAEKELITLGQTVQPQYKPKTVRCLLPAEPYQSNAGLNEAFDALKQAPRQEEVMMLVAEAFLQRKMAVEQEVKKRLNVNDQVVRTLKDKGLIQTVETPVDRLEEVAYRPSQRTGITLTPAQERALARLRECTNEGQGRPTLLHGITGSGKTHLYIELIRDCLARGQQALYLLPEIALTKQIIERLKNAFGEKVGVYHSRFSQHERVEIWQKVIWQEYQVVIGVRSAIFLPFDNLGLIVVDEEHDSSFKQFEPAPRYNAREVAVWYGHRFGLPVVLGSATPSLESYYNVQAGKFHLVELHEKALALKPVHTEIVDMRPQVQHKLSYGLFSEPLLEQLKATLTRGEQAILFKNRRGYAPFLRCTHCGHVPQCMYCDISMTYHQYDRYLRCHYCGYTDHQTERCAECGEYKLQRLGIGTQRLEEHLQHLLPHATIQRMDQDTTRGKKAFEQIISSFERGDTQILLGTQMVTKGLDFPRATLVAVLDADQSLHWPDFRANEATYQLLTQFAGRTGRSERQGYVYIQTYQPDHPIFGLLAQPYPEFYRRELATRYEPYYPPYCRLIRLELQHKSRDFLLEQADELAGRLRPIFGANLLGPEFPLITRIRNLYRQHLLIKIDRSISPAPSKRLLQEQIDQYFEHADKKTLRVMIDVDPR